MKIRVFFRTERGTVVTLAILVAFVCAGISLAMVHIRQELKVATAFDQTRTGEHEAWVALERFFKDNLHCSQMMKGKKLGDTILGGDGPEAPQVGRAWKETGWIVKDLYLLSLEDQTAWELGRFDQKQVFVKVTLVPKPRAGLKVGVEYMLNAPSSTRLIPIKVMQAEELVFTHCRKQDAENACYQAGIKVGVIPELESDRAPASADRQCQKGVVHRVHCLLPQTNAPIWSCIN